ncbi:hypothetical protein LV779_36685 [Streptomyces thinghirensis]|nr:hypothetical protein [Streptomyces thinghirensis]
MHVVSGAARDALARRAAPRPRREEAGTSPISPTARDGLYLGRSRAWARYSCRIRGVERAPAGTAGGAAVRENLEVLRRSACRLPCSCRHSATATADGRRHRHAQNFCLALRWRPPELAGIRTRCLRRHRPRGVPGCPAELGLLFGISFGIADPGGAHVQRSAQTGFRCGGARPGPTALPVLDAGGSSPPAGTIRSCAWG